MAREIGTFCECSTEYRHCQTVFNHIGKTIPRCHGDGDDDSDDDDHHHQPIPLPFFIITGVEVSWLKWVKSSIQQPMTAQQLHTYNNNHNNNNNNNSNINNLLRFRCWGGGAMLRNYYPTVHIMLFDFLYLRKLENISFQQFSFNFHYP